MPGIKFQSREHEVGADALVEELMRFLNPDDKRITPQEAGKRDMKRAIEAAKKEIEKDRRA